MTQVSIKQLHLRSLINKRLIKFKLIGKVNELRFKNCFFAGLITLGGIELS